MSKTITTVNTSSDTFQIWIDRTNEVINAISTEVLTANSNANGSVTTGNSFLSGIFHATTLTASTLRGGNVQTSDTLTITSNVVFSSNLSVGNSVQNVTITSSGISINGTALGLPSSVNNQITSSTQVLDFFDKSVYRAAEYTISINNNSANGQQVSKLLVMKDNSATNALITEYAVLYTNNNLGVFSANSNTTHCILYCTLSAGITDVQVKASKTLLVI
jgi:hypothetical protein